MFRTLMLFLVFLFPFSGAYAAKGFDHSHKSWNSIIKKYIKVRGPVSTFRYGAAKKSQAELDAYLKTLEAVKKSEYDAWNRNQKMSFLINAYNAFTVKLILNNYPLKSIKKIGGLFSSPWKKEFFTLLGKKRHLDWIEHETLRPKFKEPRIHFAVNCASIGCPALREEAFVATKLEKQLEDSTVRFLRDTKRNRFDVKKKELYVSKIFKWFDEDFERNGSTVAKFVSTRITSDKKLQKLIATDEDVDVEYLKYSWDLNDEKEPAPKTKI